MDYRCRAKASHDSTVSHGPGAGTFLIGATIVLTARSDEQNSYARLAPAAADQLGIGGITLLVIRPDGHVGLRADRNHIEALMAYHALLVSGRT